MIKLLKYSNSESVILNLYVNTNVFIKVSAKNLNNAINEYSFYKIIPSPISKRPSIWCFFPTNWLIFFLSLEIWANTCSNIKSILIIL